MQIADGEEPCGAPCESSDGVLLNLNLLWVFALVVCHDVLRRCAFLGEPIALAELGLMTPGNEKYGTPENWWTRQSGLQIRRFEFIAGS